MVFGGRPLGRNDYSRMVAIALMTCCAQLGRPMATDYCALLNGSRQTVCLSYGLIELLEFAERDLKLAVTR